MNASNVRAFTPAVNPSPEDVCLFLKQKAERGEIAENSARLKATSIRQLVTVLGEDEPKTAQYVLENIQSIATRWATLNSADAKGETAKTYESRARSAIESYFEWVRDPKGFKFKRSAPRATPEAKEPKAQKTEAKPTAASPETPAPAAQAPEQEVRSFPLGAGREAFNFMLPSGGLDVRDVRKIVCHLLTLAKDFDPTVPSHAQVFSIVTAHKD
ncbi:MAG TPA: hypothetical protein VK745_16690 [Polyangiaceae bacterium]|jgi:hypothetical protein|nr:hypothetical protein [Polyangiaceae bacterium]